MTNSIKILIGILLLSTITSKITTRTIASEKIPLKELKELALKPYGKNWGLNAIIGVSAYEAWKTTQGSNEVMVAVVDTGIDITHPALKNALWRNPGETGPWEPANEQEKLAAPNCHDKSCNKIDDDHNGLTDDVNGWDFVRNQNVQQDDHGHGTHVAGIIAAGADMKAGRGGVAPKVKISAYSYFLTPNNVADNEQGKQLLAQGWDRNSAANKLSYLNVSNTTKALTQAVNNDANIINYSGGGYAPEAAERAALKLAQDKGILVVVAAGNGDDYNHGIDMDQKSKSKYYPCAYGLDNIICVGNVDAYGQIASSSNQGIADVQVFAPGMNIYSTWPGGGFNSLTGTSQATAFVSGVAALILSQKVSFTKTQAEHLWLNLTQLKLTSPQQENLSLTSEQIKQINLSEVQIKSILTHSKLNLTAEVLSKISNLNLTKTKIKLTKLKIKTLLNQATTQINYNNELYHQISLINFAKLQSFLTKTQQSSLIFSPAQIQSLNLPDGQVNNIQLNFRQVKALIMNSVDKLDSLKYATLSQGKINAATALAHINEPKFLSFDEIGQTSKLLTEKMENDRFISSESNREEIIFKTKKMLQKKLKEYIKN